jgi:membrane associated rhomboid family serine protease
MTSDTIKVLFTYLIATLIIVGGGAMLFFTRLDPPESNSQNLSLVVAGFVGAAVQFVFNRETQTQTARQVERGIAQGSATPSGTAGAV